MTDSKKKRLSMLDNLAAAGSATPSPLIKTNRPLRAARDAVDGHKIWDLDPYSIDDTRVADRLDPAETADLRASIETTGQTVPILVRRHPKTEGRYLLVYGRRRLEAILSSAKVTTIRALIANLDENAAVEAQITENMARKDLSYIEKALFAHELVESGFGNQAKVAEVLTVTKSSVSMALNVVSLLTPELIRVIGAAHGVGRPRWDALAQALEQSTPDMDAVIELADDARTAAETALIREPNNPNLPEPSLAAFEAVFARHVPVIKPAAKPSHAAPKPKQLKLDGKRAAKIVRTKTGLRLDISQGEFADWLESNADALLHDLHDRWKSGGRPIEQS